MWKIFTYLYVFIEQSCLQFSQFCCVTNSFLLTIFSTALWDFSPQRKHLLLYTILLSSVCWLISGSVFPLKLQQLTFLGACLARQLLKYLYPYVLTLFQQFKKSRRENLYRHLNILHYISGLCTYLLCVSINRQTKHAFSIS